MSNIKAIAFYLPQYHVIKENNEWYGEGFTEWTNVGKAKKLYKNHYQPKVPKDLGYYDLRCSETRLKQARMAKEFGVDGFCYYHYWFGENRQLLQEPFEQVLNSKEPDFPFMLCWANETWYSKFWNIDGSVDKKPLIEQRYGDEKEFKAHFDYVLKAFKDERYIKIDDKPVFMIYLPFHFKEVSKFIKLWKTYAKESGLKGIYFIAQTSLAEEEKSFLLESGFDAINTTRLRDVLSKRSYIERIFSRIKRSIFNHPIIVDYKKATKYFITDMEKKDNIFPSIFPNWDHTPRSGSAGLVLHGSTPEKFAVHLEEVFKCVEKKSENRQICFIKSWNEWGEGNYLEPDLKFGKAYLETFKKIKDMF